MKYVIQFLVIIGISFLGELLKICLPFPVPASIYGMVILFLGLITGFIPLKTVKETGKFLIENMPVMFIPAGVGLLTGWGTLRKILVPFVLMAVVPVVTVMIATGWVSQMMMKSGAKDRKNKGFRKMR